MPAQSEDERSCLLRLTEMAEALARMQGELPEDVQPLGDRARGEVRIWQQRLAQGGADLQALSAAMREISSWMDALAARLLLSPWSRRSGPSRPN